MQSDLLILRFNLLLSRLLFITEGKYGNQLKKIRKFRVVLSSGSKVTASDSAKPGPRIHIFFLSQRLRVSVEMGTKSEKVCVGRDGFSSPRDAAGQRNAAKKKPEIHLSQPHQFWLKHNHWDRGRMGGPTFSYFFIKGNCAPFHFGVGFSVVAGVKETLTNVSDFCGDRGRGLGARTKLLGVSN